MLKRAVLKWTFSTTFQHRSFSCVETGGAEMGGAEMDFFDDISAQVIFHVLKRQVLKWGRPGNGYYTVTETEKSRHCSEQSQVSGAKNA